MRSTNTTNWVISPSRLLSLTSLKCNSTQLKISCHNSITPPPPSPKKKILYKSPVCILEDPPRCITGHIFPPQNNNTPSFYLVFYTLIWSVTLFEMI